MSPFNPAAGRSVLQGSEAMVSFRESRCVAVRLRCAAILDRPPSIQSDCVRKQAHGIVGLLLRAQEWLQRDEISFPAAARRHFLRSTCPNLRDTKYWRDRRRFRLVLLDSSVCVPDSGLSLHWFRPSRQM